MTKGLPDPETTLLGIRKAWEAGDAAGYADQFTADADYTAFDGTLMAGRQAIEEGHRALFEGIMRGSRMTFQRPQVRYLSDDIAVVTVRGGIIMRWQRRRSAPSPKRVSALTYVMQRAEDRWLVTAFQNTRYRPWDRSIMGRMMTRSAARTPAAA